LSVAGSEFPVAGKSNNLRIGVAEPATVATDYLIAAACGYFALSLAAANVPVEWTLGFALGGASALLGGTVHRFPDFAGNRAHDTLWWLTLLLFGASAAAFGAGAVHIAAPAVNLLSVRLAAGTAVGIYAIAVLHKPEFRTAGKMALLMLGTFTIMGASLALRGDARPAALMFGCVILNAMGIAVQLRRLAPHSRFNHNDLFHVFQLAALWCLYLAVRSLL